MPDKDAEMKRFSEGKNIMVATTVIEVGVNFQMLV
jgi:RecG-like helicase